VKEHQQYVGASVAMGTGATSITATRIKSCGAKKAEVGGQHATAMLYLPYLLYLLCPASIQSHLLL
jgi:hypothetical protein